MIMGPVVIQRSTVVRSCGTTMGTKTLSARRRTASEISVSTDAGDLDMSTTSSIASMSDSSCSTPRSHSPEPSTMGVCHPQALSPSLNGRFSFFRAKSPLIEGFTDEELDELEDVVSRDRLEQRISFTSFHDLAGAVSRGGMRRRVLSWFVFWH